jgi:purine-cytosine permease-like protein
MKLTYETGTATLIQFIVLSLLNIVSALVSIITTCRHEGGNCTGNLLTSIIFYIMVVGWFGLVTVIGYAALDRRSKRLAQLLIITEVVIALVALFNIKLNLRYHSGWLSLFTSLADLILAVWIITLAYRLMKAGGGRVVRQRQRHRPSNL